MDTHSQFCGPPPSHMIRTFAQNLGNYLPLEQDENWHHLLTDVADLLDCQFGKWKSAITSGELKQRVIERNLPAVIHYVYQKEVAAHGKSRIFLKENHGYHFLPFLLLSFPEADFVYLHRDPRDVALSWKVSPNHPGGVIKSTEVWKKDQEAFWLNYGILRSFNRAHRLSYEALITNTEQAVGDLCQFLAIPYEEAMLTYHEKDHTRENAKRLKDWENLGKPVISSNLKKYRDKLSTAEVRYIEHEGGSLMEKLGYERDYPPEVEVSELINKINQIETSLRKNPTQMTDIEKSVRVRRLEVIKRIINRQPVQL